jgi:hypothetical protein
MPGEPLELRLRVRVPSESDEESESDDGRSNGAEDAHGANLLA